MTEKAYTPCATCGRRMPPESDPRTVVFCSPTCYGRDVAARGVVHIYPPASGAARQQRRPATGLANPYAWGSGMSRSPASPEVSPEVSQ